jgi:AraC-like DNA-binding protein
MASAPGMRAKAGNSIPFFTPRPPRLPFSLQVDGEGTTAILDGGGIDEATLVCGFVGCDTRPFNPLLASLPRMLRIPGAARETGSWVSGFLRMAVDESNRKRPGGVAVLERMSEMLFVEALRRYADGLPLDHAGWLSGMRDAAVGRVLSLIHERPAEPWTLERLSEESAMSRSTLHERFVHFIGEPPMQYLANWRMQLAARWLRDTDAKVIDVASEVGYQNEAAFSRAFRRAVGESPAAWRRAHQARPPSLETPRRSRR